ncbi:hypothetical protein [Actinoplanes sp. GCM10030250]|uniref:hypothetical protein n=1 Tax=Actinoplanes sp. GCM10030250 TaxID=3273376 RepID=UPI003622BBF0
MVKKLEVAMTYVIAEPCIRDAVHGTSRSVSAVAQWPTERRPAGRAAVAVSSSPCATELSADCRQPVLIDRGDHGELVMTVKPATRHREE